VHRTCVCRFLSGSSVLALLRMINVPLESEPFQALDCGPHLFCCEDLDIFRMSMGLFLLGHLLFHMSFRNFSNFLPCNISSCLLESVSSCVFITFIAICKSSGMLMTICKISTGVVTLCTSSRGLFSGLLELFFDCELFCIHLQIFELHMLLCLEK